MMQRLVLSRRQIATHDALGGLRMARDGEQLASHAGIMQGRFLQAASCRRVSPAFS